FQSRHGKAYFFIKSFGFYVDRANVYAEKKEDIMMMTGLIFTWLNAALMLDGNMSLLLIRTNSTRKENQFLK
ncbi:hypothetical protein HID58_059984, partial [Brassica napus]